MSNAQALCAVPSVTPVSEAVPVPTPLGTKAGLATYKQMNRKSLMMAIGDVFFLLTLLVLGIALPSFP
jgi:hypothetical protein